MVARPDLGEPILIFSSGMLVGALLVWCTAGNDDDKKNGDNDGEWLDLCHSVPVLLAAMPVRSVPVPSHTRSTIQ